MPRKERQKALGAWFRSGRKDLHLDKKLCDFKDKFGIEDFAFTQMCVVGQQEISFYCLKEKLLGLDVDSILVTLNFL